ncbi:MAG: hypothetical protein IID16_12655 [Candidatus Marinimicrobia bacterium]|nr:hypothetical protein [Candidatus Neomarinimicrobiota bacterium]
MVQIKVSIEDAQNEFLNHFREFGFKDKSSVVRTAIDRIRKELEIKKLEESADLYSELYEIDPEIKELTESAIEGWPGE